MGLRVLIGHGADATEVADVTGAFAKLRPGWAIVVYSSAALERLVRKTSSASSATCADTPRYARLPRSACSHHHVPPPGRRPGLACPGAPHLNDGARHRQNPAQQTGGAPWHRYRMTRT